MDAYETIDMGDGSLALSKPALKLLVAERKHRGYDSIREMLHSLGRTYGGWRSVADYLLGEAGFREAV